jgi:NAD-dependent deacetylase
MDALAEARSLVAGARSIAVLSGAGVSAESGIPTFRDALTGLWARFRPEELATPEAFARDPGTVWEWYAWRRTLVDRAQPNAAHAALVEMERCVARFALITQNVDGLHERAGSRAVIELHGNIRRSKCFREGRPLEARDMVAGTPPTCVHCGAWARPDVVWFGEALDVDRIGRAYEAARSCDVFLSVGTSGLVEPAASLPFEALAAGAAVIEVNPVATPLTRRATLSIARLAGEALPLLVVGAPRNTMD